MKLYVAYISCFAESFIFKVIFVINMFQKHFFDTTKYILTYALHILIGSSGCSMITTINFSANIAQMSLKYYDNYFFKLLQGNTLSE